MEDLTIQPSGLDFGAVHAAMRRYVDLDILPGVSHAVLRGRDVVDLGCVGWADRERRVELRIDHLFRVFSNTKLVTSSAVMLLVEEGRIRLDDPVERYLPPLADRVVLKPGATSIADVEPSRGPITIRHLLSHSAGLTYGFFEPGTLMDRAYSDRKVLDPTVPLSAMIEALAPLPLLFHPGTSWAYSVATDVLARLVEVVSGDRFDAFIQARILDPLGMVDTAFVIPKDKRDRFTTHYLGADLMDPMKPGLNPTDAIPFTGAFIRPFAKIFGGSGLVSTLPDMVALVRSLLPDGKTLLRPETIALMRTNQLAPGVSVQFPFIGKVPGKGYGLAGAVTLAPSRIEPRTATGELEWGGIAGTHWWMSPQTGLSAVVMTQRHMAFWHPFAFEFKRLVYEAAGAR